jgi:creatinine amidohydrolase
MEDRSLELGALTWVEAGQTLTPDTIALLPVGSTEAHGPHLPLSTDVIISEGMARRAARALAGRGIPAVILPSLAYGVTEYASPFSGTLSISPATLGALLNDIAAAVKKQGVETLCLVNSHLEPGQIAVLRQTTSAAAHSLGMSILFPDKTRRRWVQTLPLEFQTGACHAGSYETSLVLADRPELVRDDVRRTLEPVPVNLTAAMQAGAKTFVEAGAPRAYFGAPAEASAAEGESIYAALVEMIVTTVVEYRETRRSPAPPG